MPDWDKTVYSVPPRLETRLQRLEKNLIRLTHVSLEYLLDIHLIFNMEHIAIF